MFLMMASLLFQKEQKLVSNTQATAKPLTLLFIASEMDGLVKTGGLADVAKALPAAL